MVNDNYIRTGKVINVVDGDTIDIDINIGFYTTIRQRFRLLRINTPEKFGETKAQGLTSKEFTKEKLLNKEIVFQSFKTDSFKRWLAEVYYIDDQGKQINISDELLNNNLAVEFIK